MKKFKTLLLFLFLFPLQTFSTEYTILSWNTFLLPPLIKSTFHNKRAPIIAKKLSGEALDFILLQEVFSSKAFDLIESKMKEKGYFSTGAPKRNFFKPINSGLVIYSKFPIVNSSFQPFTSLSGADFFSSKGVLSATVKLATGKQLVLMTTHFQAHSGAPYTLIRNSHLKDIESLFEKSKTNVNTPIIWGGDFNISTEAANEYSSFLASFKNLGLEIRLPSSNLKVSADCNNSLRRMTRRKCTSSYLIDHIFTNNVMSNTRVDILEWSVPLSLAGRQREIALSDHHPIKAVISYPPLK